MHMSGCGLREGWTHGVRSARLTPSLCLATAVFVLTVGERVCLSPGGYRGCLLRSRRGRNAVLRTHTSGTAAGMCCDVLGSFWIQPRHTELSAVPPLACLPGSHIDLQVFPYAPVQGSKGPLRRSKCHTPQTRGLSSTPGRGGILMVCLSVCV